MLRKGFINLYSQVIKTISSHCPILGENKGGVSAGRGGCYVKTCLPVFKLVGGCFTLLPIKNHQSHTNRETQVLFIIQI